MWGTVWGTAGEPLGNRQFRIVMHGAVASSQARWPDGKHVGSKSRDAPQKVTDLFYLVQSSGLSGRLSRRSPTIVSNTVSTTVWITLDDRLTTDLVQLIRFSCKRNAIRFGSWFGEA